MSLLWPPEPVTASDSLSCGFPALSAASEVLFVSQTLSHDKVSPSARPVLCHCCDTELAAGELQRCWIPSESGALKAQLYLEQVTLQQTGPAEGDFSFLTEGSVQGGESLGGLKLKDKRHWGQGSTELGLSCSHQGFDGDFRESWPNKTAPQLGSKATKSPAGRGVRTPGKHRAETPAWRHAGFSLPGEKWFLSGLLFAALSSQREGKVVFQLLCFGTLFLATCSLCSSSSVTSSWPLTAGPLDFLTLLSACISLPCAPLSPLPSVLCFQ